MEISPPVPTTGLESKNPILLILLGLVTTAAALGAVWGINLVSDDFNLMGLYMLWIIPVGALLVGVAAGSGYGLGSWWTGVRISRNLLLAVVLLQIAAYFAAQYIDYLHLLSQIGPESENPGFLAFFDWSTRQIQFKGESDSDYGDPLGTWGYAFRALELGGFVLGGMVVPLALKAKPYCEQCQVYMRTRDLVLLPASTPNRKIKRKDTDAIEAWQAENEVAHQAGMDLLDNIWQAVDKRQIGVINDIVSEHKPHAKETGKLLGRIALSISTCPSCAKGHLFAASLTGHGNDIHRQELGSVDLSSDLTRQLS